jgi:hypothetical protein
MVTYKGILDIKIIIRTFTVILIFLFTELALINYVNN